MKRRSCLISFLLSIVLIIASCPLIPVYAENSSGETTSSESFGSFEYSVIGDSVIITKYKGKDDRHKAEKGNVGLVEVPSVILGKRVSA